MEETKTLRQKRKSHNEDIVKRMREGDSLSSFSTEKSWFPDRPTIKKDKEAIERLYGLKPIKD